MTEGTNFCCCCFGPTVVVVEGMVDGSLNNIEIYVYVYI